MTTRYQPRRSRPGQHDPVCPTCGSAPHSDAATERLREELQTIWWSLASADQLIKSRHCGQCQPHNVYVVACLVCGDGPILAGQLAEATRDAGPQRSPQVVIDELTRTGWRWATTPYASGWVCCQ